MKKANYARKYHKVIMEEPLLTYYQKEIESTICS
jgi:hypothetical protein